MDIKQSLSSKLLTFLLIFKRTCYRWASKGFPSIFRNSQPMLVHSKGIIEIHPSVSFGVYNSPHYFSGYSYINLRRNTSILEIGSNTRINNNLCIISEGAKIQIGENCLIGYNVTILDSDFHHLNPVERFGSAKPLSYENVLINNNVFIGNNVTILKGVEIGENSVIGANSLVVKNVPDNVIVGGNPARVIKSL